MDLSIKNVLKNISSSRGIFLELPELDLLDVKNLINYRKVIGLKDLIDENYTYNDFIELNVVKDFDRVFVLVLQSPVVLIACLAFFNIA